MESNVRENMDKEAVSKPKNFKELKKLGLRKLRSLCVALDLERNGTKRVLQDRIATVLGIETCGSGHSFTENKKVTLFGDQEVKEAYQKILPLSRLRVDWSYDCRSMPTFDLARLKRYLIHSTDKTFDDDSLRAYKTLRSYALFDEGHLDKLEFYRHQELPFCFFRYFDIFFKFNVFK